MKTLIGGVVWVVAIVMPFAAWITHITFCFQQNRWGPIPRGETCGSS